MVKPSYAYEGLCPRPPTSSSAGRCLAPAPSRPGATSRFKVLGRPFGVGRYRTASARLAPVPLAFTPPSGARLSTPAEYGARGGRGHKARSVTTGFPKRDVSYLAARI